MSFAIGAPAGRILNFDIEARPLGWYGGDFTHKEVTVIASAWEDDPNGTMEVMHLTKREGSGATMLRHFLKRYNEATVVVGHYIRGFDLPLINSSLMDYDLPSLTPKATHDTKGDLMKLHGISKSQENLASYLGIESPKVGMSMQEWRLANRLTPAGIDLAIERCVGDVFQNMEMHAELVRRGLLSAPRRWSPSSE